MRERTETDAAPVPAPGTAGEAERARATALFEGLRDRIAAAFEALEDAFAGAAPQARTPGRFVRSRWSRAGGGGGVMAVMRGRVFEKVGVNVSTVWGTFAPELAGEIPGAGEDGRFWASGISLVAHMCSPRVPAAHMNLRHIATTKSWFGGGADLTPMGVDAAGDEDAAARFHAALEAACDAHDPAYYARFKAWADEYFYLPHRGEPRGAGGIFFDYLDSGGFARDLAFAESVGRAFLEVYSEIVRARMDLPFTAEDRAHQLVRRGRYVEFNLIYDRGTRFGLMTGGNPEAVLMSLPPLAAWP